ncbi:ABC transporter substrate-binding protein [Polaromonas sp. P1(28)-8]|nr:ABC transporter substrate-binding protein [Polaromonas sp. P1(28)-8]
MKINPSLILILALLGMPLANAVEVVIGQVGPMSGLDANQGRAYAVGMQLMFNNINKVGGINGHTFALVRKDDGGRPGDTVSATKQLLTEEKPLVLAGFFGNRNITDLVSSGVLEVNSIAVVGYRTTEVRSETPLLYNVRASLRDEINKITEHLATVGINRIGLFTKTGRVLPRCLLPPTKQSRRLAPISFPKHPIQLGRLALRRLLRCSLKPHRKPSSWSQAVQVAAAFIEQYRAAGGASQLLSYSGADIEQLSKRLSEEQLRGVAIAQVVPNPYKISGRLAKEFSDTIAKTQSLEVPVSYTMMEGYIAGKVIVEAVRRQGRNPSRSGFVTALDGMDSYDLGGYLVSFKPGMRSGAKFVELSIISGSGKIRQ